MAKMKTCKVCKERYEKGPRDPSFRNWCSTDCGVQLGRERMAKQRERAAAKAKAKTREADKKVKTDVRDLRRSTISWQHKLTQKAFNKMRKLEEFLWFRDKGVEPECISCGKTHMDWACGHYKTVGSQPHLRYARENTYLQCNRRCNMALSGNITGNSTTRGYEQGLIDRFGEDKAEEIKNYCEQPPPAFIKPAWQDLEKQRAEYNKNIRTLTSELEHS